MVDFKVDILAIGVHPDDVELSCSGTLLKHIDKGYKVAILDLTKGELGSRGSAEIRMVEASNSAQLMGVSHRASLDMRDGFFTHNEDNLLLIVKQIRKYRPRIVLANALSDRHPDHGRAAKLISDACFLSGLLRIKTQLDGTSQEKWRPEVVYHYIQDVYIEPDFVVDITDYMDTKMESILCYKSQFFDPNAKGPDTPISGQVFLEFIKSRASTMGRNIGATYAEGFNKARDIGVEDLFDLR